MDINGRGRAYESGMAYRECDGHGDVLHNHNYDFHFDTYYALYEVPVPNAVHNVADDFDDVDVPYIHFHCHMDNSGIHMMMLVLLHNHHNTVFERPAHTILHKIM